MQQYLYIYEYYYEDSPPIGAFVSPLIVNIVGQVLVVHSMKIIHLSVD